MNLSELAKQQIILASSSPRRKQLLSYIIEKFDVVPSSIEESASGMPSQIVLRLAKEKARDVAGSYPEALVIGADTIVVLSESVLGKPKDEEHAKSMLKMLSGRKHKVYTGVAIVFNGSIYTDHCVTEVTFDSMTEEEIGEYIATGEPMDKAGAYGIQGFGAKFIHSIEGDYFNVMGLPLNMLYRTMKMI
jgi:septum formation protein